MKITLYQDKYFYYIRKPAGIASTFGKSESFLDVLLQSKQQNIVNMFSWQKEFFGKEEEYWLLNRLDNDTSWLLYFAKTPLFKAKYKQAQSEWKIKKYYVAEVYWKFSPEKQNIDYPIWHHKFSSDRMVVIKETKLSDKIKWKLHEVETKTSLLCYDENKNTSILKISIEKWIRHQIRTHLSSIWYPIIWEKIYINKSKSNRLELYSVWLFFDF